MESVVILLFLIVAGIMIPLIRRQVREERRQKLRQRPFPNEWKAILEKNVHLYPALPRELKSELHGHIQVFLAEKNFEGAGGLAITDEIRLTVAAQACILLLNRKPTYYPRLYSIIVYPHQYEVDQPVMISPGHYVEGRETHLGESWHSGAIVLAWDHARQTPRDIHDGHNLVFHEFAHQLDEEDGQADGVPMLGHGSSYITWARVLGKDYRDLRHRVAYGMRSFMDLYGAKNEAEFFAVATECFFETPEKLKNQYPDLYEELRSFYNQDPGQYENTTSS